MKVWTLKYELKPVAVSSAVKHSTTGVLLKFEEGSYSLYHPIESLADQPLKDFMSNLSLDNPVFKRVRGAAVSLESFKNHQDEKIKCYYSCPSFEHLFRSVKRIEHLGFQSVKLKVKRLSEIEENLDQLKNLPFKFIFDFNGREKLANFKKLQSNLKVFFTEQVSYVEDPFVEVADLGGIKLASDFIDYGDKSEFSILKPTGFNHVVKERAAERIVVTSYLDHPLGQMISALWASKKSVVNECGLRSDAYYQETAYTELLGAGSQIDFSSVGELFELLGVEDFRV